MGRQPGAGDAGLFPETLPEDRPPGAAEQDSATHALAARLPAGLHLGTSSWNFPGWRGLVWDGDYSDKRLSREGISAYAKHPLFKAVSLDRAFYQPLTRAQFAAYADAVPDGFKYVVKAPAQITDSLTRGSGGKARAPNPDFMRAELASSLLAEPAADGLGDCLGALVFQFSPLMAAARNDIERTIADLHAMLGAARETVSDHVVLAVEVRDPEWLCQSLIDALKDAGATYCLGLHPRLPPVARQLPLLRALWPGPFVCRWNLNMRHGIHGYEQAKASYAPFDTLVDPDETTRDEIARVAAGTAGAGQPVFVTVNNKAEGSAPRSVAALAARIDALRGG